MIHDPEVVVPKQGNDSGEVFGPERGVTEGEGLGILEIDSCLGNGMQVLEREDLIAG